MSRGLTDASTDLIRWTFTIDPTFFAEIEAHLDSLGADVLVRDRSHFQVTWEKATPSLDGVAEAIWSLNGDPFKITQEEFHRLDLLVLQQSKDDPASRAA